MLCYRDMTFCTYYETCAKDCPWALTPEVQAKAEKWWTTAGGSDSVPICRFAEKPQCFKGE